MKPALEALDRQRRILDYKRKYIAARLGWNPAKVSAIFNGQQEPKLSEIWALMGVLHIDEGEMAEYFPKPNKKGGRSA